MKFTRLVFSVMALFGIVAGQVGGVVAQGGSGLQVSPTRTELTVEAGSTESFDIQLTNVTNASITAQPTIYDFTPKDDGSPQINTDENSTNAASVKSFLGNIDNTPLTPGQKTAVKVNVNVPKDQAAGAYYGIIVFNAINGSTSNKDAQGSQVALSAGVGHIVLIQVPGQITDKMQLVKVVPGRKTSDNKVTTGSIFSNVPNQIEITVRNTGNSILKPFGTVTIEKGGKAVSNIQLNNADVKGTVLPNSNRIFTEELKDLKGFGRFNITTNVSYGNGGDILTLKQSVWVIPVWLGAGIGVGVLAIAAVVFVLVRKFRR